MSACILAMQMIPYWDGADALQVSWSGRPIDYQVQSYVSVLGSGAPLPKDLLSDGRFKTPTHKRKASDGGTHRSTRPRLGQSTPSAPSAKQDEAATEVPSSVQAYLDLCPTYLVLSFQRLMPFNIQPSSPAAIFPPDASSLVADEPTSTQSMPLVGGIAMETVIGVNMPKSAPVDPDVSANVIGTVADVEADMPGGMVFDVGVHSVSSPHEVLNSFFLFPFVSCIADISLHYGRWWMPHDLLPFKVALRKRGHTLF
ncbi:hypothetical protein GUJ93_ZPchr0012g20281 [Zizania palustris]|uniref:Uncharacterized protein n=1 Tax=Zizania palustris TaxID=103762 RepID=A0A8J6BTJ5_ZIZPA|nr:hypothetical protein GUJ93_ZPchr0012g20281 [Zizania palustris]